MIGGCSFVTHKNMKKIIHFFLILTLFTEASHSQIGYDSCILKMSKQQVINELARYSEYWINDSLANNGFRHFFGREFFRCSGHSLVGTKWSTISSYLGKAHFSFKGNKDFLFSKNEILYRYVLLTYGDYRDYKDIGNIILDIIVVNGIIKFLGVQEVDG